LLDEPFSIYLIIALPLVLGGIILISRTGKSPPGKQDIATGSFITGLLATLGAALCWGTSPALVKMGLREVNSPIVATFISYAASSLVAGFLLANSGNRQKLGHLDRSSLFPIIIAATFNSGAHIMRYVALSFSPVSLVAPLINGINGLLVFPLSYLINRHIETFDFNTITGALAVIAGVLLIFLAA
jgi:drug/metabolite transporter (DMT)-like permease